MSLVYSVCTCSCFWEELMVCSIEDEGIGGEIRELLSSWLSDDC